MILDVNHIDQHVLFGFESVLACLQLVDLVVPVLHELLLLVPLVLMDLLFSFESGFVAGVFVEEILKLVFLEVVFFKFSFGFSPLFVEFILTFVIEKFECFVKELSSCSLVRVC